MKHIVTYFPEQSIRVETGVIQFGSDWPGVFIRGDHCMHYAQVIGILLEGHEFTLSPMICATLKDLGELLKSSNAHLDLVGDEGMSDGEQ